MVPLVILRQEYGVVGQRKFSPQSQMLFSDAADMLAMSEHYNKIIKQRAKCDWDVAALNDNCWGAMCAILVITTHINLHNTHKPSQV
jgi:hypothetical protein